jgi:hypothetical protein
MSMKRWIVVAWMVVLAVGLALAAGDDKKKKKHENDDGTSENIFYATYQQKAGPIAAVVGSYGASFEEANENFMLQIAVGLTGDAKKELDFSDKSFTLLDSDGNLYAMTTPTAMSKEVELLDYADEMQHSEPLQLGKEFDNLERINSSFYATKEDLQWASVHLKYSSYFEDVVFFPKPKSGFDGVLTLNVLTAGMAGPVEVHFRVPEPKKSKDSNKDDGKKS